MPNEAQRAPPVIFLKDLDGGKHERGRGGEAQSSLRREGIPRTREEGRPRSRRSKPLEPVLREFFYLSRGSLLEELAGAILLKDVSSSRKRLRN